MTKKLLYSPGYGAGWTTWTSDTAISNYLATYQPIIDFIEGGGDTKDLDNGYGSKPDHPLIVKLQAEVLEKFGEEYVCLLGAGQLCVLEVEDGVDVRFHEYDGSESPEYRDSHNDWY